MVVNVNFERTLRLWTTSMCFELCLLQSLGISMIKVT